MIDNTREAGLLAQRGVREQKMTKFGPLIFSLTEMADVKTYGVMLALGVATLTLAITIVA